MNSFAGNPLAIHAHLLGQSYGLLPTSVLSVPAGAFWTNAAIYAAGTAWEHEQRQRASQRQHGPGVATDAERADLVRDQERRADQRAAQPGQPSLAAQAEALRSESAGGP